MTAFEYVTDWMYHQQRKHGMPENTPELLVNAMSNWELLQVISEYIQLLEDNMRTEEP